MIHVFHGEHIEASRKELSLWKEKFTGQEVVVLEGKTISSSELEQSLRTSSLFGLQKLIIVEQWLSKISPKTQEAERFFNVLSQLEKEVEVIFWENKEIGKTILSHLPKNVDIAIFKPSKSLFVFLEKIKPGNTKEMLELFDQSLTTDPAELLFSLLVRQFRYLLQIKELGKEVKDLSPWQVSKFMQQAKLFSFGQLISAYEKLLEIDVRIKNGTSAFDLTRELKLFLIAI